MYVTEPLTEYENQKLLTDNFLAVFFFMTFFDNYKNIE